MFVCVCVALCVVMGLDRLISISWVCVFVALCVEPVLEVEGERKEKKLLLESEKPNLRKSDGWKKIIKKN